jgi:hypothetical protein
MEKSTMFFMVAFLSLVALASIAHGGCYGCKEGNWQESAAAFLEGRPINDEPVVFTAKAAREQSSQFEKKADDSQAATGIDSKDNDIQRVALQSINATPASINSTATTRIAAVFAVNSSENVDPGEMQLSANGVIKDSAGREVAKLTLIKQSDSQYTGNWTADVPPGIYSMDIAASSIFGAASFKDALQIEVLGG